MQLPAHTATLKHVFILLQTRRRNYIEDDDAANDGEPDLQSKEMPRRAKATAVARKVQPLSFCLSLTALFEG